MSPTYMLGDIIKVYHSCTYSLLEQFWTSEFPNSTSQELGVRHVPPYLVDITIYEGDFSTRHELWCFCSMQGERSTESVAADSYIYTAPPTLAGLTALFIN